MHILRSRPLTFNESIRKPKFFLVCDSNLTVPTPYSVATSVRDERWMFGWADA